MSGHSKWHSIKRKKGAADTKRGAAFTKLGNAIALAARDGADPELNFKLRLAIDKAKAANMPVANIDRSVARGAGQLKGSQIEAVIYEGYGPAGVAFMVECATDNKNRTSSDVRTAFSKNGGRMAEPGAVAFQFQQKGVIQLESADLDEATLDAIDAGASDVDSDSNTLTVVTDAKLLNQVQTQLVDKGHKVVSAELSFEPTQTVPITNTDIAKRIIKLLETLDELDDVTNVSANADFEEDVLRGIE